MLNLTISDDWQPFIEGKLRAGHFASAEEVVGEGLRALKEQESSWRSTVTRSGKS